MLAVRSTNSNITYVPKELMTKFAHIKQFLLSNAGLESIDGAFELCDDMEVMKLYQNKIKRIESRAFAQCPNLLELDFSSNEITELSVDAFEGI